MNTLLETVVRITMRVEFLVAWEDQTWSSVTVDVPLRTDSFEKLIEWANHNLATQPAYRKAVLFAVYSVPAGE